MRSGGPRSSARVARARAFAKVNLTLRVCGVQRDGYHTIETIFQSLALHDTLTFTEHDGPFEIRCDDPACPVDERNLVWRAADGVWRLARRRSALSGVRVRIVKRIPMQAGLGGGSSDAAATIRALAGWWGMDVDTPRVRRLAAGLGADVPFFFHGGTALGVGRGDTLTGLPDVTTAWVVIVLPSFGVSTAEAYGWWDEDERERARAGAALVVDNDLQPPVDKRHPQIGRIVRTLERLGASHAAMSGSGSAVFGLFSTQEAARAAGSAIEGRSRRAILTRTLSSARYQALWAPTAARPSGLRRR